MKVWVKNFLTTNTIFVGRLCWAKFGIGYGFEVQTVLVPSLQVHKMLSVVWST